MCVCVTCDFKNVFYRHVPIMDVRILATCEAALLSPKATFRSCPVAKSPIAAVATVSVGFSKPAKKRNVKVSQNL